MSADSSSMSVAAIAADMPAVSAVPRQIDSADGHLLRDILGAHPGWLSGVAHADGPAAPEAGAVAAVAERAAWLATRCATAFDACDGLARALDDPHADTIDGGGWSAADLDLAAQACAVHHDTLSAVQALAADAGQLPRDEMNELAAELEAVAWLRARLVQSKAALTLLSDRPPQDADPDAVAAWRIAARCWLEPIEPLRETDESLVIAL